jgi:hypothetical protein
MLLSKGKWFGTFSSERFHLCPSKGISENGNAAWMVSLVAFHWE